MLRIIRLIFIYQNGSLNGYITLILIMMFIVDYLNANIILVFAYEDILLILL